jgi:hypothetical protein
VPDRIASIGKEVHSRLRKFFDAPLDSTATPLEVCQAVLDDVERRIEPVGRGRRVFPYTRLTIALHQRQPDRAPLESVFGDMGRRIRERLEEVRCETPRSLEVNVIYLPDLPESWRADQLFAVEYVREPQPARAPQQEAARAPVVHVHVLKGASAEGTYTFTEPTISIGRSADATDDLGRMRRNRIAFLDAIDGVTETVGRAHARLRFDAAAGSYRLFDEGSSNGTWIIRGGATIPVLPRDPRGVRVQSGDEIAIGRAVIRVTLDE